MAITVLVVDDTLEGRTRLEELISSQEGFEVVGRATDGTEGLELFGRIRPDAVLTDYWMPELTGLGLAQRIREKPEGGKTVIVICSDTYIDDPKAADAAVSKDVDPTVLAALIREALPQS